MSQPPGLNLDQIKCLRNPVRLDIVTSLRAAGDGTIAQIAERLGKDEVLLYYHIKQLIRVGLISLNGSRATATKPEAIFSANELGPASGLDLSDASVREEYKRGAETLTRAAAREFGNAVETLGNEAHESCLAIRIACSMSAEKSEELKSRLFELSRWLHEDQAPECHQYSVTILLSQLVQPCLSDEH